MGIKIIKKFIEIIKPFLVLDVSKKCIKTAICKIFELPPTIVQRLTNCLKERRVKIYFSIIESIKSWNSKGIIRIIWSKKANRCLLLRKASLKSGIKSFLFMPMSRTQHTTQALPVICDLHLFHFVEINHLTFW